MSVKIALHYILDNDARGASMLDSLQVCGTLQFVCKH